MRLLIIVGMFCLIGCGKHIEVQKQYYQGVDGNSCTVTQFPQGLEVACTDGTSAFIYNGKDGENVEFEVIDPCGPSGNYDEVLLRFDNGLIIASFSDNADGKNTRFSVLTAGLYMTTDNSRCQFEVDNRGNVINDHY